MLPAAAVTDDLLPRLDVLGAVAAAPVELGEQHPHVNYGSRVTHRRGGNGTGKPLVVAAYVFALPLLTTALAFAVGALSGSLGAWALLGFVAVYTGTLGCWALGFVSVLHWLER